LHKNDIYFNNKAFLYKKNSTFKYFCVVKFTGSTNFKIMLTESLLAGNLTAGLPLVGAPRCRQMQILPDFLKT